MNSSCDGLLSRILGRARPMPLEDHLLTESRNPHSEAIDRLSAREIVAVMAAEDAKAVAAVRAEEERIAQAIEQVVERFQRGGRLIYVGAGTSGRLGVLDAAECPPTFSTPPEMVVGLIAGGHAALTRAIEGAEDHPEYGASDIDALNVSERDLVVGIATSGRTPYVLGAVQRARERGAFTVGIACNRPSLLGQLVDLEIAPLVGPEVIAGSTRLKAGTATKLILNMISTGAMVRIGKTLGNRMIDLQPTNEKLRIRSRRILRELAGVDDQRAIELLRQAGGRLKPALVAALTGVEIEQARALLEAHGGHVRPAVEAAGTRIGPSEWSEDRRSAAL
jgi:N-acetylmuramic acid 6-phosphate etherase